MSVEFTKPFPDTSPSSTSKRAGTLAACHFPLTREEVEQQLPVALTAPQASPTA